MEEKFDKKPQGDKRPSAKRAPVFKSTENGPDVPDFVQKHKTAFSGVEVINEKAEQSTGGNLKDHDIKKPEKKVSLSPKLPARPKKATVGCIIRRTLLCIGAFLLFVILSVYVLAFSIAHGPSETIRNTLVMSALQASATKWAPGLFLSQKTVDEIVEESKKIDVDIIDVDDYEADENEWDDAIDGMKLIYDNGTKFKAYVLLIKDPSRVFVGPSFDYSTASYGKRIFDACQAEGAVAAINGGEYPDNGFGTGSRPMGITYSKGKLVWNDANNRTFMGFDNDNKLIVKEGLTKAEGEALGIRDGVSFNTGNLLIENKDGQVTFHYNSGDDGVAQRTSIGQRADGTVIMIVTDGRTASSIGATRNEIIDMMKKYGAVTAGMLDGGSSSMLYYNNYYEKYGIDTSRLDQWQLKGLVNKYKAFTNPRYMPTFFMVKEEAK